MNFSPSWLVIGYGNSLRRDDGAGLLLAQALADVMTAHGLDVRLLQQQQLTPELVEDLAAADLRGVIFVDAAPARASEPDVDVIALTPDHTPQSMTHHVGPQLLLAMADRLYGSHAPAWLVTVAGVDFGHGDRLSPEVEAIIGRAPVIWSMLAARS